MLERVFLPASIMGGPHADSVVALANELRVAIARAYGVRLETVSVEVSLGEPNSGKNRPNPPVRSSTVVNARGAARRLVRGSAHH